MNRRSIFVIAYVTWGALFYGYDSGLTTSVIGYPQFLAYYGFDGTTLGLLNSVYWAGNFVGALMLLYLPNKIGKLRTIVLGSVIALAGISMQTGAKSLAVLLAGRALGGLASGIVYAVSPTYASEIAPPHLRGRIGGLFSFNISFSYMVTEWMGLGFSYISTQVSWRLLFGLQVVPALVMITGSFWMPESPRWLTMKGREDEALAVLKEMHGTSEGDSTFYLSEFTQIKAQLALEKQEKVGLMTVIKQPSYRKRVLLLVILATAQQTTGIIPLQYYQVILYETLGLSGKMPLILVGIWGTTATLVNIPGAYFFDRVGRRRIMLASLSILIPANILFCAFWATFENTGFTKRVFGILAIVFMFTWLLGYAIIFNSFFYTYIPEILPTPVRAGIGGVIIAYTSSLVICLAQTTPIAIEHISWKFFLIFVICTCIYAVIFYFYFPETANKTLEEIGELFGERVAMHIEDAETEVKQRGQLDSTTEGKRGGGFSGVEIEDEAEQQVHAHNAAP